MSVGVCDNCGDVIECPECSKTANLSNSAVMPGYKPHQTDTARLNWILRKITGSELRDMGIELPYTGDTEEARKYIDMAMGL